MEIGGIPVDSHQFVARIRKTDQLEQTVFQHCDNVAALAGRHASKYGMKQIATMAGRHHDAGKNTAEFEAYLRAAMADEAVVRGSVTHSTHGAALVSEMGEGKTKRTAELIRIAILSHHGLRDCLTTDGKLVFAEAERKIKLDPVKAIVYEHYGEDLIEEEFSAACREMDAITNAILALKEKNERIGAKAFYDWMYVRLLNSLLIDADRTEAACFGDGVSLPEEMSIPETVDMWKKYQCHCEAAVEQLQKVKEPSILDDYRREISERCARFDGGENGVFQLVVPCGAGKTLSTLRYALQTAKQYGKRHIFYIAPFHSILEQNADELKRFVGDSSAVLEHHSNIVFTNEQEEDARQYELLTENWVQTPIVATTAVQFLNTLLAGPSSNVRRMQALGNSVIILDEIQALPIKVLKLFNAAMNFLAYCCNSSIVLCSATQPLLDQLDDYQLCIKSRMIEDEERYTEAFKRVEIVDHLGEQSLSYKKTAEYLLEQIQTAPSLLAVVNTKACARHVVEQLRRKIGDAKEYQLFHLSTNMCPAHRSKVLSNLRTSLAQKGGDQKVLCISTSLIEAGVDISFARVVRSLAGLDSIVQAAGRCNRNQEAPCGLVSVISIQDEHVGYLGYLKQAQEATREVFYQIRTDPSSFPGGALSKAAMDVFYARYYRPLLPDMAYPLKNDPEHTILDLLTTNPLGQKHCHGNPRTLRFKQAFREAGAAFSVIEDGGKQDVIVEYNDDARERIQTLLTAYKLSEKRAALRSLQQYTVALTESTLHALGAALRFEESAGVFILSDLAYDPEFGVSDAPKLLFY